MAKEALELEEMVESDDLEYSYVLNQLMKQFSQWTVRDGQSASLTMMFVVGQIIHGFDTPAVWFERFVSELYQHIEEREESWKEIQASRTNSENAEERRLAETLARDERYARARNENQRRYVASQLFPDTASHLDLNELLELASLIYWDKIEPEPEPELVQQVVNLKQSGIANSNIAAQLGITRDRVNRLVAIAESQ